MRSVVSSLSGTCFWFRLLLAGLLAAGPAAAVEVQGLTEVSSLVKTRDAGTFASLARRGLGEVLVRLSGHRSVLADPAVMDALDRAESYLVQSRYESTEFTLPDAAGNQVPADRLVLSFSKEALSGLLRNAGMPLWGSDRSTVLAWVLVEGPVGSEPVTDGEQEAGAWLLAQGEHRGLPVRIPLWDLTDQMAVSADSVRQFHKSALETASRRYGADHFIAGVISPAGNGYRARWMLSVRGEEFAIEETGSSLQAVTAQAVNAMADRMAARYAVRSGGGVNTSIHLTVEGIGDLASYASLQKGLDRLSSVQRAELTEVRGTTAVYRLEVEGTARQFVDQLALNRNLQADYAPEQDSSQVWRLHYRYVP